MGLVAASKILAIRTVENTDGNVGRWAFYNCAACGDLHGLPIDYKNSIGAKWSWNGNVEKPTFSPSILSKAGDRVLCHHFVRDGMQVFCGDTPPSDDGEVFANRTVPLPELPTNWRNL